MSDKSSVTFESIVAGLANELCGEISTKFNPLKFKDKTIISSFPSQKHKDEYIENQLVEIQNIINNTAPVLQKYISHNILDETIYSNNEISYRFLLNICNLYLIENHFDLINTYYNELIYTSDIFFGQNERYPGEDVYWQLFSDKHMVNCNINDFIALVVSKIRQSFLAYDFLNSEILKVENIEDKSINIYPSTNDNGHHKVNSEFVGEHDNINLLIDTNVISNSPTDLKKDLDFPNANNMINFKISYSACSDLTKYFNYDNCSDSTPSELYHWYDVNFRSFKDEVLTNLMSIPSDGKIPYLEKLGNLFDHDFSYHNPDKSQIDVLFKKYNTTEDEFISHNIKDADANNYFNDYITLDRDFRNGNIKLEVDHIHAEIFNYYGGIANNKAKEFIDKQLKQIDPSYTLLSEHKQNKINSLSIALDKVKTHTHEINYNVKYNSYKKNLSDLLLKYCEYSSSGNVDDDLEFIKGLGYIGDNCSKKGDYCPHCIYYWLKNKLSREICLKAMPFNSYKEKLDFILSHDELFDSLSTSMMVDDKIHFTTFPQNEEESDIYITIAFELKEKENKEKRINGKKEIYGLPIVSFAELKCNLYKKAIESADPKLLLDHEYNRILNLFPKGKKYGIESIFWYMHDLKVNATKHIFNNDDDHKSIGFVEYGPLAEHYVNYYFYLKRIIEGGIQSFIDRLKFVSFDFIHFDIYNVVPLSQIKKEEILYSGKYIVQVCCLKPIGFMSNIFRDAQITHDEYNIIFRVFTDHGFWDFGELKYNNTKLDPNNSHIDELIQEIFSISESLLLCREKFLIEFKNFVIQENSQPDYTLPLVRFKKRFHELFDKIYIHSAKPEVIKLTALDYMLKVVNNDDSYIINKFGRLIDDYKNNYEGSWQNVNPFFVYSHISERYAEFKDYVFTELLKYQSYYDKKFFLLSIENKLTTISWHNITIEDILEPYGITFIDLFEKTNNSLAIVHEIKYDSITILEIQRTKGKEEADRVYEQKFDVFYHILSYWRNKAIVFIREQLSELSIDLNQIVQNNNNNVQKDNTENALTDKGLDTSHKSTSNSPLQSQSNSSTNQDDESNQITPNFIKSKTKGFIFERDMDKQLLKSLLDDHHDTLVKLGYISSCKTDFKSAYMGGQPFNKIMWRKSFPELKYYITKLKSNVKDDFIWATASLIFLKNDGTEFTNRQLHKTKKGKKAIQKDIEIDEIFSDFFSTLDT